MEFHVLAAAPAFSTLDDEINPRGCFWSRLSPCSELPYATPVDRIKVFDAAWCCVAPCKARYAGASPIFASLLACGDQRVVRVHAWHRLIRLR